MSLTSFHLLFIAASIILAVGLGAWAVDAYLSRGGADSLVLGGVACLLAAGLVLYGRKVRLKFKHLGAS
jgi:hypothetical protein